MAGEDRSDMCILQSMWVNWKEAMAVPGTVIIA